MDNDNQSQLGISKLYEALSKAQGEFIAPEKTKTVKYDTSKDAKIKYKYADLAAVMGALKDPLSKNGLAITHQLQFQGEAYMLITRLVHTSGESLETIYPMPNPATVRPQDFGSAYTYARRYSVQGIVGIAPDDEDDGEDAPKPPDTPPGQKFTPSASPIKPKLAPTSPQYFDDLDEALKDDEIDALTPLERFYKLVDDKKIATPDVKEIIRLACSGVQKISTQMSPLEIDNAITLVKLHK